MYIIQNCNTHYPLALSGRVCSIIHARKNVVKPKYFFFDIDGTLVPFGKDMPESAKSAIRAAQALGNRCFLSTGRSSAELPGDVLSVGFDGIVSSAGCRVDVEGENVFDAYMDPGVYSRTYDYLTEHGLYILVQKDQGTFMSERTHEMFDSTLMSHIGRKIHLDCIVHTDEKPSADGVRKLLFLSEEDGWGASRVKRDLDPSLFLVRNTVGLPYELMGEIVRGDITKATGIEMVLGHYGADRSDSVAVGDGSNDIEMVEWCGLGIAMGNSTEDLIEVADWVSTDVEDDGLKNAIFYALREEWKK